MIIETLTEQFEFYFQPGETQSTQSSNVEFLTSLSVDKIILFETVDSDDELISKFYN